MLGERNPVLRVQAGRSGVLLRLPQRPPEAKLGGRWGLVGLVPGGAQGQWVAGTVGRRCRPLGWPGLGAHSVRHRDASGPSESTMLSCAWLDLGRCRQLHLQGSWPSCCPAHAGCHPGHLSCSEGWRQGGAQGPSPDSLGREPTAAPWLPRQLFCPSRPRLPAPRTCRRRPALVMSSRSSVPRTSRETKPSVCWSSGWCRALARPSGGP